MDKITISAPAKINLYLDVTDRRSDGFHDIESVMQSIDLCDVITVSKKDSRENRIRILCDEKSLPADEKNLAYIAAEKFFEYVKRESFDIEISIEKRIPFSAGLAGGSSDAAATLIALNELFQYKLSNDELCKIGEKIGSDVPFCIKKGIAKTFGKGEIIIPVSARLNCFFVIAKGNDEISTPKAYRKIDEKYTFPRESRIDAFCDALMKNDISILKSVAYNIFESVTTCESVEKIKKDMLIFGAELALMSGSGPSVFGVFTNEEKAISAARHFNEIGIFAAVAKPYFE